MARAHIQSWWCRTTPVKYVRTQRHNRFLIPEHVVSCLPLTRLSSAQASVQAGIWPQPRTRRCNNIGQGLKRLHIRIIGVSHPALDHRRRYSLSIDDAHRHQEPLDRTSIHTLAATISCCRQGTEVVIESLAGTGRSCQPHCAREPTSQLTVLRSFRISMPRSCRTTETCSTGCWYQWQTPTRFPRRSKYRPKHRKKRVSRSARVVDLRKGPRDG